MSDVSVASPEPEVKSSLADFGNFVGVESAALTVTPTMSASAATDVTSVDSNVATTSTNKQATKEDIMALYSSTNQSSLYNMPAGNCLVNTYSTPYPTRSGPLCIFAVTFTNDS